MTSPSAARSSVKLIKGQKRNSKGVRKRGGEGGSRLPLNGRWVISDRSCSPGRNTLAPDGKQHRHLLRRSIMFHSPGFGLGPSTPRRGRREVSLDCGSIKEARDGWSGFGANGGSGGKFVKGVLQIRKGSRQWSSRGCIDGWCTDI